MADSQAKRWGPPHSPGQSWEHRPVCVHTAAVHLAGAMGLPVWLLMRHEGAPFFGVDGESAPWYPSVRVWRQSADGEWAGVLERVGAALASELER